MLADRLENEWRERRASTPIDVVMRFSDEGLVLGAGVVLARAGRSARTIEIDIGASRLLALLAAAHRRAPTAGALTYLRKAAECWGRGEDDIARMHLSLSGLARLEAPEADAQRLFLADRLLQEGLEPRSIFKALDLSVPAIATLSKYDPDQPRVPAGSGSTSGEWTTSGGSGSTAGPEAAGAEEAKQRRTSPRAPKTPNRTAAGSGFDSSELIQTSNQPLPTRDQIRSVLYNEFASLHLTDVYGGPDLIAAEIQVGYVLMNRAAHGWAPGNGTASAVIKPATMQAIRDNPSGTEGRAYAIADLATASMKPFGGDVEGHHQWLAALQQQTG